MSLSEFELIQRFFTTQGVSSSRTTVGIGDDAAVLKIEPGFELVTSVDVLNQGVHFPKSTSAYDIGVKALAVSLSDLAAMGAKPFSVLLTLSVPMADARWFERFAQGFFSLATRHHVALIGGDVVRGPLSISTVANGVVPQGAAILRSCAQVNDLIYVSGTLGDAGLALALLAQNEKIPQVCLARLNCPSPRVALGLALRGLVSSAMDISDGLVADLEKLCVASGVGAVVYTDRLPLSDPLKKARNRQDAEQLALTAGDDYELVFTVPPNKVSLLSSLNVECRLTCIGEIKAHAGVEVKDKTGKILSLKFQGYDHFGGESIE